MLLVFLVFCLGGFGCSDQGCVHVDFMFQLLRHDPQERLGSGVNGVQELKAHPFFSGTDWEMVHSVSASI